MLSVVREPKEADQNTATGAILFSGAGGGSYNAYDNSATDVTKSNFLTVCNRFPPFAKLHSLKNIAQNDQINILETLYKNTVIPEEEYDLLQLPDQSKNAQYKRILATADNLQCGTGKANETFAVNNIKYRVVEKGSNICAIMYGFGNVVWPEINIGCHETDYLISGSSRECSAALAIRSDSVVTASGKPIPGTGTGNITGYDNGSCYKDCNIANSCVNSVDHWSLVENSITAPIMQCIKESVNIALTGDMTQGSDDPKCKTGGLLYNLQKKLRQVVLTILTLSVAFFALKAMMTGSVEKKDFFIFILKISLVAYFTMPSVNNGADYWYRQIEKLRDGIMSIVTNAVGNQTICKFYSSEYQHNVGGRMIDFAYLQLWDQIDCRFLAYLGGNGVLVGRGITNSKTPGKDDIGWQIATYLQNLILGLDIFLALLLMFFTAMFIAIAIWVLGVYLICMIALALLMFLSPIFIPMILFQYTKPTFDSWLKEVIAFSVFPIIIFLFIGYALTLIDDMFVGNVKFSAEYYKVTIDHKQYKRKRFIYNNDPTETINQIDPRILSSKSATLSNSDEQSLRKIMYKKMYIADQGALYNPKTITQEDIDNFVKKNKFDGDYDKFLQDFKVKTIGSNNGKLAIRMINMGNHWKKDSLVGLIEYHKLEKPTPEDSMKFYGTEDAFGLSFVMDVLLGTFFLTLFMNFLSVSGGIAGELAGGSRAVIAAGDPAGAAEMIGKVTSFALGAVKTGARPVGRKAKAGAQKAASGIAKGVSAAKSKITGK